MKNLEAYKHLAVPGFMAVGRQADKIKVRFKNFKLAVDQNIQFSALFSVVLTPINIFFCEQQAMVSGYAHLCIKASFVIIFLYFCLVISTYCPRTDMQIAISAVVDSFMHGFTGLTSHNAECANACITPTLFTHSITCFKAYAYSFK